MNVPDSPACPALPDGLTEWRADYVFRECFKTLDVYASHEPQATAWACYDWLTTREAGLPTIDMLDARSRGEARYWAETANPAELECYALAAIDRLSGMSGGHATFAGRQMKRLSGALWRRMSPQEQIAFAQWIADQMRAELNRTETKEGQT